MDKSTLKAIRIMAIVIIVLAVIAYMFSNVSVNADDDIIEIPSFSDIPSLYYNYDGDIAGNQIDISAQIEYLNDIQIKAQTNADTMWLQKDYESMMVFNKTVEQAKIWKQGYEKIAKYTYADWRMLSVTAYVEARGCTLEHKSYVCQVLLNRCADSRFNSDIYGNLVRPNQYAKYYTYMSTAQKFMNDKAEWHECQTASLLAMQGAVNMPANVIYQSNNNIGTGVWKKIIHKTKWYSSTTYFNYG